MQFRFYYLGSSDEIKLQIYCGDIFSKPVVYVVTLWGYFQFLIVLEVNFMFLDQDIECFSFHMLCSLS